MRKLKKRFMKSETVMRAQRRASCYCGVTCNTMWGGDRNAFIGNQGSYSYITDSDYRANL